MSAEADLWASQGWSSAADVYLLGRAREGSAEAYGELWRRHLSAAYAVAARHRGRAAPEDIVAEASARVFDLIRRGKGPEEHFRAYFLSTVRTVATDHTRRDLRVVPAETEQLEVLAEPVTEAHDTDELDPSLVREAFAGLSEREQRVLWHTTVEGEAPRAVAPRLGLSANAVSARAMRAREALRARYLDAHAQRHAGIADTDDCRWAIEHLGAHVRGRLPKRQAERVRQHLGSCARTAELAAELEQIRSGFPALLVPLVLLAGVSTPGFVSAGALGGLSGAAHAGGLGSGSAGRPSSSDAARDLGSHLTTLAAGCAIGIGVVGAGASAPAAPVVALPSGSVSAPSQTVAPAPPPPLATPPGAAPPVAAPPVAVPPGAAPPVAAAAPPPSVAPAPWTAQVRPPIVVPPPVPSPPTAAIVTRPVARPPVAPEPVAPEPTTTVPVPTAPPTTTRAPTPTASPSSPVPTTTTAAATDSPAAVVIEGQFKEVGSAGSIVEIRLPVPRKVKVTIVITTGAQQARFEADNRTYTCEVGPTETLTCTGQTTNAPLRVKQSGVDVPAPVIVKATTADGETLTMTIPVG